MSMESTERIEQRAGEWLARRDSAFWSGQQQAELDRWLDESLEHRVAWLRLLDTWENSLRLRALGAGIQSGKPPPPGAWNLSPVFTHPGSPLPPAGEDAQSPSASSPLSRFRERAGVRVPRALAVSLVLAGTLGLAWYGGTRNVYETPIGGMTSVPMTDGSKVTLNTGSEIKVSITDTERRVDLKQGEAFFDVAKDPKRPFTVIAGNKRITAIGTAFSVRRDGQDIQVVVTQGAVRVGEGPEARVLTAGSIARSNKDNKDSLTVQTRTLPEVEEQIAWRGGNIVFRDVSLAEAVAEFNRYNERKIEIEDPAAPGYTVGGSFRTTNVDAFVRLLERAYPLRADFQNDRIVLTAR